MSKGRYDCARRFLIPIHATSMSACPGHIRRYRLHNDSVEMNCAALLVAMGASRHGWVMAMARRYYKGKFTDFQAERLQARQSCVADRVEERAF